MDRTTHIVGTATTPMQRRDLTIEAMSHQVVDRALSDAGMTPDQVDLVVFGNATAGRLLNQACIRGQSFLLDAGLRNAGIINVDNSCAGGASALHLASLATLGGAGTVLAVGVEKMWTGHRLETLAGIEDGVPAEDRRFMHANWENPSGSVLMALNAKWTIEHMEAWGTTVEQIGAAAVKARRHGALNPHAQFQSEVTLDEVLASPAIVAPLTRLMCSSFTDGAAAVVLTLEARAGAPKILSSTVRSGNGEIDYHDRLAETAAAAWDASGVDPADVDVVELHDATSAEEICALESLGFYKPGDAGAATASGETTLGGTGVTVNTSGGLVSRGHPLGATGIAQVVELVAQLRDEAGPRQVEGARLAVAANTGGMIGSHAGTTDAAFIGIHVLEAG
ncbi:MAG TPA: thiolase family protein [Acidimicrobiales bacterium]